MEGNILELDITEHIQINCLLNRISFLKKPNVLRKKMYSATLRKNFSLPIVMRSFKAIKKKYKSIDQYLIKKAPR